MGCYTCHGCGKCQYGELAIAPLELVCAECGHVVRPGEDWRECPVCGSRRMGCAQDRGQRESKIGVGHCGAQPADYDNVILPFI